MKAKDLEDEVETAVNSECSERAIAALTEKKKEIMAARVVLRKLEGQYEKLCAMDVEEFVFEGPVGGFASGGIMGYPVFLEGVR